METSDLYYRIRFNAPVIVSRFGRDIVPCFLSPSFEENKINIYAGCRVVTRCHPVPATLSSRCTPVVTRLINDPKGQRRAVPRCRHVIASLSPHMPRYVSQPPRSIAFYNVSWHANIAQPSMHALFKCCQVVVRCGEKNSELRTCEKLKCQVQVLSRLTTFWPRYSTLRNVAKCGG